MSYLYDVAPSRPLKNYTYLSFKKLNIGTRVKINIANSIAEGFIVKENNEENLALKIKEIQSYEEQVFFNNKNLEFYKWVSDYYHYPLGEMLYSICPKYSTKKELKFPNVIKTTSKENKNIILNQEQTNAFNSINISQYNLIHGVTGSGKTEVYIEYAKKIIDQNKSVLIIVPEIALTPQLIERISYHFDGQLAVLHSGIPKKQKYINWINILNSKANLIIGARSAIFAPFKNLGLIVVDEEHEASYKQDDRLKYNAKNLALVLGKMYNAKVVLCSATPSCESYYNAMIKKYNYININTRVNNVNMPKATLIDLKTNPMVSSNISELLFNKLEENYKKSKQSILYINRRGYSNSIICKDCGYNFKCTNCDINLTEHKNKNKLLCHYCSFQRALPDYCLNCKSDNLISFGSGTERIVDEITSLVPNARIIRMDSDEICSKNKLKECLNKINNKQVDIIIGTQILGKGHDFKDVNLVGIINADTLLMLPDFRSSEKTFQNIVQVSGRAGRVSQGEVLIQTYMPEHYAIRAALDNDYKVFYAKELTIREEVAYPPFTNIAYIDVSSKILIKAKSYIENLKDILDEIILKQKFNVKILGPSSSLVFLVNKEYRFNLLLKAKSKAILNKTISILLKVVKKNQYIKLKVDLD